MLNNNISSTSNQTEASRPLKSIGRIPSGNFLTTANKLGSLHCLSNITDNLVDPVQMMTLQDGVHTHKITSEVIKRSLHRSVATPSRRRGRNRKLSSSLYGSKISHCYFQSLPVTPASHSPTRSPTQTHPPLLLRPKESSEGLTALFKPGPRYLSCVGSRTSLCGDDDNQVF